MPTKTAKLLVVDDDEDIREFLALALADLGDLNIDLSRDGLEALEMLKKADYDLVITDIRMPNLDGIGLIQEIQKLEGHTPIIISTGNEATLEEARQIEVSAFFEKPFAIEVFLQSVHRLLGRDDQGS